MNFKFIDIDPIAFSIGPFPIRWYGLAYMAAFLLGWWHIKHQATRDKTISAAHIDDLMTWLIFGVVLGGRLGYVLFYDPLKYFAEPWHILYTWEGGMSFHGGILGVVIALYLFTKRHPYSIWQLGDYVVAAAPIGLGLGRIANFINGELYGRITDVPWGIVFPNAGPWPRHPSQLYEAFGEGILLYTFIRLAHKYLSPRQPGQLVSIFLIGYAIVRTFVEFVREPNITTGYLWANTTLGQWLCLPLLIAGIGIWRHVRHKS